MLGTRFLRTAGLALELYGALGLAITVALLLVGVGTFTRVAELEKSLDGERGSLVASIRTVSGTVHDTAASTGDFQRSIDGARQAADTAAGLAKQTSVTFRQLAANLNTVQLFGIAPFGGIVPEFNQSADQLDQLSGSLAATRDSLQQNSADVQRVGRDLGLLQQQLDALANTLAQPGVFGAAPELLPFEAAFYGMCLLVLLQSVFSLVAGVALYRLGTAVGPATSLFPHLGRPALPPGPQPSVASPQAAPEPPPRAAPPPEPVAFER